MTVKLNVGMTTYRIGQIVRYANPQHDEESMTFVVLADNGDRVLIASRDFPNWRITPTEMVPKADIALVERS